MQKSKIKNQNFKLKDQIEKDFISAYKNKDYSLDVLKMIKSSIKNAEIANMF